MLSGGRNSTLSDLVARVEAEFPLACEGLIDALRNADAEIGDASDDAAQAALEQIAFVRVGLRCITDAIGELAALADLIDAGRPCPGESHPSRSWPA